VKPLIGTAGLPEVRGGLDRPVAGTLAMFVCTRGPLRANAYARQGFAAPNRRSSVRGWSL